MAMEQSGHELI